MKLYFLEQQILNNISQTFAISFDEVNKVYKTCCSFDKTIQILDFCHTNKIGLESINDILEILDKKWL